jgi:thymidylate kinase
MTSRKLTIFEGPDGGGKTHAARAYAAATGARYVHMGAFPGAGSGLARLYAEAMMPAVLGLQDVVMDRCWVSEPIYGAVHRGGADRIGWRRRPLERLALRCAAAVVLCVPDWEVVERSYLARRDDEMLADTEALHRVYQGYRDLGPDSLCLDGHVHDWELGRPVDPDRYRSDAHGLGAASAGALMAPVLFVTHDLTDVGPDDALYRWPYGSLTGSIPA